MNILGIIAALAAATSFEGSRYDDCIALVEGNLEAGRIAAQQWVTEGGGANARHCLAVADLKAGFPKLAAARLEEIVERKDAGDDFVRARILAQAAEAWLIAKENDYAEKALLRALELVPDSGELQLTAAKVYSAQERWQDVIDAVDAAETAGFVSAETYVLRGKAYYAFANYETAARDVVNALTIDPVNVDALVLRGELQQTGVVIEVSYGDFTNEN
jgi:tetratricopeptide (TPR) repeat protein